MRVISNCIKISVVSRFSFDSRVDHHSKGRLIAPAGSYLNLGHDVLLS
jgi:hypothetical protein